MVKVVFEDRVDVDVRFSLQYGGSMLCLNGSTHYTCWANKTIYIDDRLGRLVVSQIGPAAIGARFKVSPILTSEECDAGTRAKYVSIRIASDQYARVETRDRCVRFARELDDAAGMA